MSIHSQKMFFQIEEKEATNPKRYMGGGNLSYFAMDNLNILLFFSFARSGRPVLKENILLESKPLLEIKTFAKQVMDEYQMFNYLSNFLIEKYHLTPIDHSKEPILILYITSVNQAMTISSNGGMSPNQDGGFDIMNTTISYLCWWFAEKGIIVKTRDEKLLERKATFKIPASIVEDATGKEEEIQTLLEANGIHCEIVKEPALMIVPKE